MGRRGVRLDISRSRPFSATAVPTDFDGRFGSGSPFHRLVSYSDLKYCPPKLKTRKSKNNDKLDIVRKTNYENRFVKVNSSKYCVTKIIFDRLKPLKSSIDSQALGENAVE